MKKSAPSRYDGLEIKNFLGNFPVQFLLQYEKSVDSLKKQVQTDLIDQIPSQNLTQFKKAFLATLDVEKKLGRSFSDENVVNYFFEQELSRYLQNTISQAKALLNQLAQNNTILSDTHSITNQTISPVEILHDLIKQEPLTHDQIRYLWEILPEGKRKKYFKNEHISADTIIEFQPGIDSLKMYKRAAKEKTNHSFVLTPDQNRQILSNLTLDQLERHSQISYKHTAHTIESTLSTGTQYLSSWYAFLSNYFTVIIGFLTATTVKLSLVLAAGLAFTGSLTLGLTVAWQQAVENYRKEAALRMKHVINCININRLKNENEELSAKHTNTAIKESKTQDRHLQEKPSHRNIEPNRNSTWWSSFKAWFFSPLRKFIHAIKPKQSGISPTTHGIISAFFITVALVSGAFVFFSSSYIVATICAVGAFIGLLAGIVRYKTVKQERNMESIVHTSEKELQKYQKENDHLHKQINSLDASSEDYNNIKPSPTVQDLTAENTRLLRDLNKAKSDLAKMTAIVVSSEQGQSRSVVHPHPHAPPALVMDHPDGTASPSVARLGGGE